MHARAKIDNVDGRLMPGLFTRVRLVGGGSEQVLLVDDKAVLTDQDRKYVYVVGEGNRAQRKNIVIGRIADGLRVVQSGLDASDRVVVHGVQKILHPPARLPSWPDEKRGTRLVLIMIDMPEDYVRRLFAAVTGTPAPDTPDHAALRDNPLAIAGFRS